MAAQPGQATDDPLFRQLSDISEKVFGSYDRYFPYTIMWPWVAARLQKLSSGSRVLDLGSGITPLPLFLAQLGMSVDCVDNHPTVRTLPFPKTWTGWGFFDYGVLDPAIEAHHCSVADFETSKRFDAVYSIGLIAHLRHDVRRSLFARCARWLANSAMLLLAIDLIPSTDFLWNRCQDQEVEAPVVHGTVQAVSEELVSAGFWVKDLRIERNVPEARTDILLIHASR
jgi:cyclopropane fatty-acyl-phospholipid synthase-like methyltransferase